MKIHVDGDVIKYRAGFAAEKMHYYLDIHSEGHLVESLHFDYKKDLDAHCKDRPELHGDNCIVRKERIAEPVENALHNVKTLISGIEEFFGGGDLIIYLSGKGNYREGVGELIYADHPCPGYKANRKDAHRPVHGPAIVDYIQKQYTYVTTEDEEADDAMAIAHYSLWLRDPDSTCIATTDKDLDMIPGQHFNFVKEEHYEIDPEDADIVFWRQLLTGDGTDNIPGIKGVGPKTAAKVIASEASATEAYAIALECYEKQYEEDAAQALLENARLIWIRRKANEFWNAPTG